MKASKFLYRMSAAALAFGLAACGSDSATGVSQVSAAQQEADIASTAAAASAQDLSLMFSGIDGALPVASVTTTPGTRLSFKSVNPEFATTADDCPYTDGRHVCGTINVTPGLVLLSSYGFFDADAAQETFDAALTDSINLQGHLTGLVAGENAFANINRRLDVTVAKSPAWDRQHIWHGVGSDTLSAQVTAETLFRTYSLIMGTTISEVVVAMPRVDNPYPLSGSMLRTVEGSRTREGNRSVSASVEYTVLVTFNGTSIVPLDIGPDANSLTGHYCVDLAAGALSDVSGCRE